MRHFLEIVVTVFTATFVGAQRKGDLCIVAETIQPGVCRHFLDCPGALEAAFQGKPPQVCASPENKLIVCCPWVPGQKTGLEASCKANTTTLREGDNCTMVDTGKAGVCSRFSNCRTAIEAASKGIFPQKCDLAGAIEMVCCPMSTVVEGDNCTIVDTGRAGVCRPFVNCQSANEAAYKGILPQKCDIEGSVQIVCCPPVTVIEGNNCTVVDTGRAGVCSPFATCQTAKEAASKGILPQTCDVEGTFQTVCCPLSTVVEGDNCIVADTGRAGVCRPIAKCQTAKEAAFKGILPQICHVEGSDQIVCCPLPIVVEGSICLVKGTKITGVYKPFANCQTAMKTASEGTLPQISALEDTDQIVCCPLVGEGSYCTLMDTGMAGVCRSFANCGGAKKAASRGVVPQKCDLADNESELVCCANCPPLPKGLVTQLPIGSKAADYCIELAEKIHPCQETPSGWTRGDMCPLLTPDSNIEHHNTPLTTSTEAPYYGQIGSGERRNITWTSYPVSLVSDQWVLCSALAIKWLSPNKVQFVGLGGTFTPKYNPDETYGVSKQLIHPLFNSSYEFAHNGIALLRLDRLVTFTARILPACLHTGTPLPDSGFITIGRDYSNTEYKRPTQRVSDERCFEVFPTFKLDHSTDVRHDQGICSSPVNTTQGCQGWFRGAPMILPNSARVACTHLLVGLNFDYTNCLYANNRISSFISWIDGIVWPESGVVV